MTVTIQDLHRQAERAADGSLGRDRGPAEGDLPPGS